jgi:ribonuclease BN (tRNA processing enzyme)
MGVSVKCFGTGPGKSDGTRAYSAYFYKFQNAGIMVDCGEPLSLSFKKAKGDVESIDALLITHTHPDHIGGFLSFMQMLKHGERKTPLDIYLPAHAIPVLKQLLDAAYVFPERLPYHYEMQALEAGRSFRVRGVEVTPHPTTHLEKTKTKVGREHNVPFEAFSFLFEDENGAKVAHSGDIGGAGDLEILLNHELKLLVTEIAHADTQELLGLLKLSKTKKCAFVHLKNEQWKKRGTLGMNALKALGRGRVIIPKDGETIRF